MPIFEYRCSKCGESFEIITGHTERKETMLCESCGGEANYIIAPNARCKWQWEGACSVGFGTDEHMKASGLDDVDIYG